MKIYYISNMYPSVEYPYYGIFVKEQIEALKGKGVETEINAISQKGGSKIEKAARYLKLCAKALWDNLTKPYDAVHLHYIFPAGLVLLPLCWLTKKKLIVTGHGSDIMNTNKIKTFLMKRILRSCDKIIVVSEYLKNITENQYGIEPSKIEVIHCGYDENMFSPNKVVEKKQKDKKTVLFLSRLYKEKGTQTFIDIANLMKKEKDIHFLIVGDGPEKDHMIKELKQHPRVEFVGGVPKEKVANYFKQADVYVFPTQKEGYGLVALESLACGIPVVASRVGGVPEIVTHLENGYLASPKDANEFVDGIKWVLNHEAKDRLESTAINDAIGNTINVQVQKVYDLYEKLIKGRNNYGK